MIFADRAVLIDRMGFRTWHLAYATVTLQQAAASSTLWNFIPHSLQTKSPSNRPSRSAFLNN
jgi:hypothetical protein